MKWANRKKGYLPQVPALGEAKYSHVQKLVEVVATDMERMAPGKWNLHLIIVFCVSEQNTFKWTDFYLLVLCMYVHVPEYLQVLCLYSFLLFQTLLALKKNRNWKVWVSYWSVLNTRVDKNELIVKKSKFTVEPLLMDTSLINTDTSLLRTIPLVPAKCPYILVFREV